MKSRLRTQLGTIVLGCSIGVVSDKPIPGYQVELLDLAFKTASALPLHPHVKNRSRLQESVVTACFELDQPRRALAYVEKIDNWRRGIGYADFAFYCAEHGDTTEVQHYLDLASDISSRVANSEDGQDWERDRIRVGIARTHALLGHSAQANEFDAHLENSEVGKVDAVKAKRLAADAFGKEMERLDRVFSLGNFDLSRNALETCAQLFDRFYDDHEKRERAESTIKSSWSKLPILIRVDLMIELAGFALDHKDPAMALELVNETRAIVDGLKWKAEHHVPLVARLAALRDRAGEKEAARKEADAERALYDAQRDSIIDIYREGALRPLAEAYQSMGDPVTALAIYKRAVEEGVANPNSRPRAEDLTATCCSMALHRVEPDAALRARLIQIHDQLGQPW